MPENRIGWIDVVKGIGIILVVLGHDLRGLATSRILSPAGAAETTDRWIYSFHMPLFFFLSGLFILQSLRRTSLVDFLTEKGRTIVYPYFIWSSLTILVKASLGSIPNTPRTLADIPVTVVSPVEQYWFLYALFLLFLLFSVALYLRVPPWIIACASLAISIFPISTGWAILNTAFSYAVFFGAGVALGAPSKSLQSKSLQSRSFTTLPPRYLLTACLVGAIIPLVFNVQPLAGFAGICLAIALAVLLPERFTFPLAIIGKYSLEIFLAHTMVSAASRILLLHAGVSSGSVHLVVGCFTGLAIPLALGAWIRDRFPYAFVLPLHPRWISS